MVVGQDRDRLLCLCLFLCLGLHPLHSPRKDDPDAQQRAALVKVVETPYSSLFLPGILLPSLVENEVVFAVVQL